MEGGWGVAYPNRGDAPPMLRVKFTQAQIQVSESHKTSQSYTKTTSEQLRTIVRQEKDGQKGDILGTMVYLICQPHMGSGSSFP